MHGYYPFPDIYITWSSLLVTRTPACATIMQHMEMQLERPLTITTHKYTDPILLKNRTCVNAFSSGTLDFPNSDLLRMCG